jgi:hypothetical protein
MTQSPRRWKLGMRPGTRVNRFLTAERRPRPVAPPPGSSSSRPGRLPLRAGDGRGHATRPSRGGTNMMNPILPTNRWSQFWKRGREASLSWFEQSEDSAYRPARFGSDAPRADGRARLALYRRTLIAAGLSVYAGQFSSPNPELPPPTHALRAEPAELARDLPQPAGGRLADATVAAGRRHVDVHDLARKEIVGQGERRHA